MSTPHLNPAFLKALKEVLERFPTPFYAYDLTAVREEAEGLRWAFPRARLFFALKANPSLLPEARALGFGAEAVSPGEVERALRVLDLGGGFGLGLDLEGLSPAVEDLARLYGAEVWLEPGRRLVARSGVLVAGIWGVKRTRRTYLLLDAGLLPGRKHRVDRLPTPPPLRGAPPRPAPVRGRGGGRV